MCIHLYQVEEERWRCVCVCVCVCVQNFVYLSEDPVIEAHGREGGAGEGREGEGRETALYQEERETR